MALSAKMLLRQGQSLVMTPQLLQAIKLLQYSSVELAAFVEEELERNPLLERSEDGPDPTPTGIDAVAERAAPATKRQAFSGDPGEADWSSPQLAVSSRRSRGKPRHGGRKRLRRRPRPQPGGGAEQARSDGPVRLRLVGRRRRRGGRRGVQYRGLCRRPDAAVGLSGRATGARRPTIRSSA